MNIHEISDKFGIPIKKLARLEKAGLLITAPTDTRPVKMKTYLTSNRHLSVEQLIDLIREPELLKLIPGGPLIRDKADASLEALGDLSNALPENVAANYVYGSAVVDPDSLNGTIAWLKGAIPEGGCSYHYIAVRMMLNVPAHRKAQTYKFLARAIINLRNHPALEGWSSKDGLKLTKFHRPAEFALDL